MRVHVYVCECVCARARTCVRVCVGACVPEFLELFKYYKDYIDYVCTKIRKNIENNI